MCQRCINQTCETTADGGCWNSVMLINGRQERDNTCLTAYQMTGEIYCKGIGKFSKRKCCFTDYCNREPLHITGRAAGALVSLFYLFFTSPPKHTRATTHQCNHICLHTDAHLTTAQYMRRGKLSMKSLREKKSEKDDQKQEQEVWCNKGWFEDMKRSYGLKWGEKVVPSWWSFELK